MPKRLAKRGSKTTTKLKVKKIKNQKLLDKAVLPAEKKEINPVRLAAIFLVLLLLALAVFGYVFYLKGQDELASEIVPDIVVPEETATTTEEEGEGELAGQPAVTVLMVKILETPTGYLNVRTGPGTNYRLIGQVSPGETFEFVREDESAGWYEMRLSATSTGWVTGQYAEVISTAGNNNQ